MRTLGGKMTAIRKIVDSNVLVGLFDLPPDLKNRKVEVVLFPVDEPMEEVFVSFKKDLPQLTMTQIEGWAKAPELQSL